MNPITRHEVEVAAWNAAFVANCQCPARYRSTAWEKVWRDLRTEALNKLLAK